MFKLWDAITKKLNTNSDIINVLGDPPRIRRQDNRTTISPEEIEKRNGIFFSEEYSRPKNGWDNNDVEDTDVEFIFSHADIIECSKLIEAFKNYWKDRNVDRKFRYFDPSDSEIYVLDSDITVDWGIKLDPNLKVHEGRIIVGIRWALKNTGC